MDQKYLFILFISVLSLLGNAHFALGQEFTTFILVRHAEKQQDGGKDPSLTAEGKLRANRLAFHMNSQPLEAIYTTRFSRNTSTIYPTANLKGVITKVYEPQEELEFLKGLLKKYKGKAVLICGHSNTIPTMVNLLIGEEKYEQLEEDDYDDMFIVTVAALGNGTVTIINY